MQGGLCGERNVTFERSVQTLVTNVFDPLGFKVQAFSRVPYLCKGDFHHPYYVLSDALFVLSRNE